MNSRKKIILHFRHRVVRPSENEKTDKARQSVAFFLHFDHETDIAPIQGLDVHPSNAGRIFRSVKSYDYVSSKLNCIHVLTNR